MVFVVVASSNGDLVVVAMLVTMVAVMVVTIIIVAVRDDGDGVCWPYDECGVAGIWTVRGKEDGALRIHAEQHVIARVGRREYLTSISDRGRA